MYRQILEKLKNWSQKKDKKPLIIQGARQVGKTYVVREFAKLNYENLVYLNFETNPDFSSLFKENLESKEIVRKIEIAVNKKIDPENTLIFFDEIQNCGLALTSLKYFQESSEKYNIIAAGSLLGITLSSGNSYPVGKVDFLSLHPLNFREYLTAIGKDSLSEYLSEIQLSQKIEDHFHNKLLKHFNIYSYLGGMPEVLNKYIESNDLDIAREVQSSILLAYQNDFSKHLEPSEIIKIRKIWDALPRQFTKENRKFIFSAIAKSARAREYENALQWLIDAGILLKSKVVESPEIPLEGSSISDYFKIFMLDVGLLGARLNIDKSFLLDNTNIFNNYKGILAESITAQELTANNMIELYYWTSSAQAEVDFLLEFKSNIIPLEVKSGLNRKSKSLNTYVKKYQPKIAFRTSLHQEITSNNILDIPLYLVGEIGRFVDSRKPIKKMS